MWLEALYTHIMFCGEDLSGHLAGMVSAHCLSHIYQTVAECRGKNARERRHLGFNQPISCCFYPLILILRDTKLERIYSTNNPRFPWVSVLVNSSPPVVCWQGQLMTKPPAENRNKSTVVLCCLEQADMNRIYLSFLRIVAENGRPWTFIFINWFAREEWDISFFIIDDLTLCAKIWLWILHLKELLLYTYVPLEHVRQLWWPFRWNTNNESVKKHFDELPSKEMRNIELPTRDAVLLALKDLKEGIWTIQETYPEPSGIGLDHKSGNCACSESFEALSSALIDKVYMYAVLTVTSPDVALTVSDFGHSFSSRHISVPQVEICKLPIPNPSGFMVHSFSSAVLDNMA